MYNLHNLFEKIKNKVNTQNAGRGQLKCHATDPDGRPVQLEYTQLDKHIYSIRIIESDGAATNSSDQPSSYLNLYLEYQNAAPPTVVPNWNHHHL